jgi:hypothetical protein
VEALTLNDCRWKLRANARPSQPLPNKLIVFIIN